jgi:hypothetical protein
MKQAPQNRGASEKVTFFSGKNKVTISAQIINSLALNTSECDFEDRKISKRRREIEIAEAVRAHLNRLGLSPIFSSLDFEALRKRGHK